MSNSIDPNRLGAMVTIAITIVVVWVTMIKPFTLSIEIIGIGLSVVAITLTIIIFRLQLVISSKQSEIIHKNEQFEKSQLYFIRHNLSLEISRLLEHLRELQSAIEILQENYENDIVDDDPLAVTIDDLKFEDGKIKSNLAELTSIGVFGNMLIHEAIKEQIRKIKEMYRDGPVDSYPDFFMSPIKFVIMNVEDLKRMIENEKLFK